MSSFPSFASWEITRSTFTQLLDLYPATLRESYKRRLIATAERKHRKHPERLNRNDPVFDKRADELLKLDSWRYNELPQIIKERAQGIDNNSQSQHLKADEKYEGIFLHKDEAIKLLDWKLKRGRFRPQLTGMIKTNKPVVVRKATSDAYKALVDKEPSRDAIDDTFPKESMDILTGPLRAVGPAMASLILALGTEGKANEIPFYSDDLFLWLCVDSFPCSEKNRFNYKKAARLIRADGSGLNLKYNMHEYRQLYEEVVKLRHRLNNELLEERGNDEETSRHFTVSDMERVAYVIQHLDSSGFPNAAEILKQDEEIKKAAQESKEEEEEEEGPILGVTKAQPAKRKANWDQRGKSKKKKKA